MTLWRLKEVLPRKISSALVTLARMTRVGHLQVGKHNHAGKQEVVEEVVVVDVVVEED